MLVKGGPESTGLVNLCCISKKVPCVDRDHESGVWLCSVSPESVKTTSMEKKSAVVFGKNKALFTTSTETWK